MHDLFELFLLVGLLVVMLGAITAAFQKVGDAKKSIKRCPKCGEKLNENEQCVKCERKLRKAG